MGLLSLALALALLIVIVGNSVNITVFFQDTSKRWISASAGKAAGARDYYGGP